MRGGVRAFIVAAVTVITARLGRFASPRLRLGVDAAFAIAVAAAQALVMLASSGLGVGAQLAGVACAGGFVALAWRTRYPTTVLAITYATVFAQELIAPHVQSPIHFLAILVANYSLGAHARRRALVAGVVLGAPAVAVGHALGQRVQEFSDLSTDAFFFGILVVAPAAVGRIVRARAELAERLAAASDRLSALREQRVSTAVVAERARIASALQRAMLGGLDALAAHAQAASLEQVTALEGAARQTLGVMRGLLAGLRSGPPAHSPSVSLVSLHERVAVALATEADPVSVATDVHQSPPRAADPTLRARGAVLSMARLDLALGVVGALLGGAALITSLASGSQHGPRLLSAVLAAGTVAPIAWAHRAPWPTVTVGLAALLAHAAVAMPADPLSGITPTGLLLCYPLVVGAHRNARAAAAGLLACLGTAVLLPLVDPRAASDAYTELPATAAIIVGVWAAGRALAARSRLLCSLADTAIAIDREQRALAQERVGAERDRLARELHDAFAHSMTVIVLQAGAARRVWNTNRRLAREHADVLRDTVGEVLGELRALVLAVAHDPEQAPAVLRLEGLVRRAQSSGIEAELTVTGDQRPVPAEVEQTASRIVQEALTNAARHAPGAAVRVRIHNARDSLSIVVENGAPVRAPDARDGGGHGLPGMRERAAAGGGTLAAHALPDGGFRIAASLPLAAP